MDPAPPYLRSTPNSQAKSASRLARIGYSVIESENRPPVLSLDLISSSPKKTPTSPSAISLKSSTNSLPPPEILVLSPSPLRKSRTRPADRLEMAEEASEINGSRRRCKSRCSQLAVLGCNSPRNNRRSRRRMEMEVREERDSSLVEEIGKARKRRHSGKSKKEKLSLVPVIPSSNLSPKLDDYDRGNLDRMGETISDLVMWRDVAKSSLWFGFGCLCFLSSCFAKGVSFSMFSALSQVGLLFLGASFFSNSFCRRENVEKRRDLRLREEDFLRLARLILPAVNLAISKMQELFSGEPSMTLKVAPLLLLGAEYGHNITLRRLYAFGFFISFTLPKLYSSYSGQINQKGEYVKQWLVEAWGACSHKKLVAVSAVTAFWNLSSVKTRIFAAFISLVIIRYCQQHFVPNSAESEEVVEEQQQDQKALVVAGEQTQKW
ncbi:hypothetical protein SLEP1_g9624 [Rubroshorea leprosula]|uniref:Reticulon-like protein n=1 Tax=Rubroshorea leprosula TaxID=152421 RepID=A0AAV5I5I0_9ROSI|nr:hypothetical protein SLEP1_g9624 [Rubroshorea leprosula]